MNIKPLLTAALILASTSAIAESHICIGGDLDALTPAQVTACKAKSAGLRQQARLQGSPENWRFVVICDEAGWAQYASFPGNDARNIMKSNLQTDAAFHVTFLRGSRMQADSTRQFDIALSAAGKGTQHTPNAQPPEPKDATDQPLLAFAQDTLPAWRQR